MKRQVSILFQLVGSKRSLELSINLNFQKVIFLANGISLYLGEVQMKIICERSLQALLSSRAPLLPHTSLVWLPFARPNGEHGEQRLLYHYLLITPVQFNWDSFNIIGTNCCQLLLPVISHQNQSGSRLSLAKSQSNVIR